MRSKRIRPALRLVLILAALAAPAWCGPISLGDWGQFSFTSAGTQARGCDPADPAGNFCIPSSGTPTTFLDAPGWTFTVPIGAILRVTDTFEAGDQFEVFDFGVSLGLTSIPAGSNDCGDDPAACIVDPNISSGLFNLGSGDHSITIVPVLSPGGGGSGFLRADAVPEPSSWLLLGGGLVALVLARRRAQ